MPREKKPKIKRITADQRKDWRNLPISDWNTLSFTEFFRDMNAELYGVDTYLPMRNWRFEQAQIKRAIDAYGAALLRQAFDECFRDYRPTREYPILTAGFCVSYRINGIIPRLIAEEAARGRVATAITNGGMSADDLAAWL